VLALRALKLGDLLVAVPALRALRRQWPDRELVLATTGWLRPVVDLVGSVDTLVPVTGLHPLDPAQRGPLVAVNLHGAGPESNAILDALEPVTRIGHGGHGWDGPAWDDSLHERDRWCALLEAHGVPADPLDLRLEAPAVPSPAPGAVVVHPGAAYGSKRWPVERFAAVARELMSRGHRVVVTGGASEVDLARQVPAHEVLAGSTDLTTLCALVRSAALVISGDTGVAHVAYAYGTPSVTLYGPVGPENWGPPPGPHTALTRPDLRRGTPFADDPDPALLAITTAEVLSHCEPAS
jgi:ADP-heptose:LPS heptosyltransferase